MVFSHANPLGVRSQVSVSRCRCAVWEAMQPSRRLVKAMKEAMGSFIAFVLHVDPGERGQRCVVISLGLERFSAYPNPSDRH